MTSRAGVRAGSEGLCDRLRLASSVVIAAVCPIFALWQVGPAAAGVSCEEWGPRGFEAATVQESENCFSAGQSPGTGHRITGLGPNLATAACPNTPGLSATAVSGVPDLGFGRFRSRQPGRYLPATTHGSGGFFGTTHDVHLIGQGGESAHGIRGEIAPPLGRCRLPHRHRRDWGARSVDDSDPLRCARMPREPAMPGTVQRHGAKWWTSRTRQ